MSYKLNYFDVRSTPVRPPTLSRSRRMPWFPRATLDSTLYLPPSRHPAAIQTPTWAFVLSKTRNNLSAAGDLDHVERDVGTMKKRDETRRIMGCSCALGLSLVPKAYSQAIQQDGEVAMVFVQCSEDGIRLTVCKSHEKIARSLISPFSELLRSSQVKNICHIVDAQAKQALASAGNAAEMSSR